MRTRMSWTVVGGAVAATSLVASLALPADHLEGTSRLDPTLPDAVVHSFLGLLFILLGARAWALRPHNRTGPLLVAVGFLWFLPDLRLVPTDVTFTLAYLATPFYLGPLAHAFLAFPIGRLRAVGERTLIALLYGWLLVGMLAEVALYDPLHVGCAGCPDNLLLLRSDPNVRDLVRDVNGATGVAFVVVLLAMLFRHWRGSSGLGRRIMTPVTLSGAAASCVPLFMAVNTALVIPRPVEQAFWTFAPVAVASLPITVFIGLLRTRLDHALVTELVTQLGNMRPVGELEGAMARALRDPGVRLYYWLPEKHEFVDSGGNIASLPEPTDDRAVTTLERDGEPIAAVVHHPWLDEEPTLVTGVLAAASIALENERLHAKVRAQLEDVRASRARIVEAADEARRRLERDLHDGAQQRLVNLSLMLRMLDASLERADTAEGLLLHDAEHELSCGISELRELARGIHPALLSEAGLGAAIESLVERSRVPARVKEVPERRFPPPIEAAVYFTVSEALANAGKHSNASEITVSVRHERGELVVEVIDDGVGGADQTAGSGLRGLADRVAAVDGRLKVESPAGAGTCVVAEIRCE